MTKLDFIDKPVATIGEPRFNVVSTFSGCGGSSLGYMWAGGKVLLAVEWDDNAVETYRLNFPQTDVFHGDIATLSVEEVLQRTYLRIGELDILDGSPPCQGFSTAGKRQMDDPRNQLFREYIRLLRGLQPKVFIMENVSGMVKGKMKLIFAEMMQELKASGYQVSARLMDAAYFGVPQHRQRLIFVGVRDDLGVMPSHPKGQKIIINLEFAPELKGKRFLSWRNKHGKDDIKPIGALPNGITRQGIVLEGRKTYRNIEVVKLFFSFSTFFQFSGTHEKQLLRIGNSVPPRFMQAIAEHVYENILSKIQ